MILRYYTILILQAVMHMVFLMLFRSRHHNKNVSWLRKTEYISTEYNRFTQTAHMAEAR